jgi:CRISPR/Cas system-associated exonuclease Cas4 (RecB family)
VRLQYIDRVPYRREFVLFFTKGNAVHLALQRIAEALRSGRTPISDTEVMEMARLLLPPQEFPTEDARLAEARDILRCIQTGRRYLEGIPNPTWLLIERKLRREWRLFRKIGPYKVLAKPDVIVQRDDEDGEPMIEIIDYKTGTRWLDEMPPLLTRLVARPLLDAALPDVDATRVRFTYLWLKTGERDVIDLTPEHVEYHWGEVFSDMKRLASEADWKPTPSSRCRYCPYFENVCTEKIPIGDSSGW